MKELEIFPLPENDRLSAEERESWSFVVLDTLSEPIRLAFNLLERGKEKAFLSYSEATNWLEDSIYTVESYFNDALEEGEEAIHITTFDELFTQQETTDSELVEIMPLLPVAGECNKLSTSAIWAGFYSMEENSRYVSIIFLKKDGKWKAYQLD